VVVPQIHPKKGRIIHDPMPWMKLEIDFTQQKKYFLLFVNFKTIFKIFIGYFSIADCIRIIIINKTKFYCFLNREKRIDKKMIFICLRNIEVFICKF